MVNKIWYIVIVNDRIYSQHFSLTNAKKMANKVEKELNKNAMIFKEIKK